MAWKTRRKFKSRRLKLMIGPPSSLHATAVLPVCRLFIRPPPRHPVTSLAHELGYFFAFHRQSLRPLGLGAPIREDLAGRRQSGRNGGRGWPGGGRRGRAGGNRSAQRALGPTDTGTANRHAARGGPRDRPALRRLSRCRGE